MPNIASDYQQHRRSKGEHANWQHKRNGSCEPLDKQLKMLASQPGLHSGNVLRHSVASTFIHFASMMTNVGNTPAISLERAKMLTVENRLRFADNLFQQKQAQEARFQKAKKQHQPPVKETPEAAIRDELPDKLAFEKYDPLKFPQAHARVSNEATLAGRWERESKSYIVSDEHQKNELIHAIKDYLKSDGNLNNYDANDFEYYARSEAAGNPVVVAHIGGAPGRNTLQNEQQHNSSCVFTEQVLSAEGDVAGKVLVVEVPRDSNLLQKMVDETYEGSVQPIRRSVNSANIISLGVDPSAAKLIACAKRWQHSRPKNNLTGQSCNNTFQAFSADNDSKVETSFSRPAELMNVLPASKRAAWYTEDPTTGIRKEIVLELKQRQGETTYLLPTGKAGEFKTYYPNRESSVQQDAKVLFDEHDFSWRYANGSQRGNLHVQATEGNSQINLHGKYYAIRPDGEGRYVIAFDNKDGQKQYIPVYKDKITNIWHLNSQDGHYAFLYQHDDILNDISVDMDMSCSYRSALNNNPELYGDGVIYSKVRQGDSSNYSWGRYIDMNGRIVPVRNIHHTGPGVRYEVFNEKNPEQKGYQIKWADGRWLFADLSSEPDLKDSLQNHTSRSSRPARSLNSNCPSWETQYEQLADAGIKDTVISVRHRGDLTNNIAENSLSAFRNSYNNCRAGIETDVLTTKDNEYVIFHDTHIGKMMEPLYDPDTNTGPNPLLKDMTLDELKGKNLLDPRRNPTNDKIITARELIQDLRQQNGQSLIYLEVKDPKAILPVAKIITEEAEVDPTLLKRVILKFNMAEFPTYVDFVKGLRDVGANSNIMANPVMSPGAAERINSLPYTIPNPKGEDLYDNASRSVYWWSHDTGSTVANVEIVAKGTDCGFINVVKTNNPQGEYYKPASLDISNTRPGTMAYRIAIVKRERKSLGTYVPVADRIMWKDGLVAGVTVPNRAHPAKQIDITKAYYNNDASCCYDLKDRLDKNEKEDIRYNLAWNHDIGANIITSDDTNTIDTYFNRFGVLDRKATPNPKYPMEEMKSTLASSLNFWLKEMSPLVRIKGWGGASASMWGGEVCLMSNPYPPNYAWVYKCDDAHARHHGYNDYLTTKVVEHKYYGAAIQIYSEYGCLDTANGYRENLKWINDCEGYLPESQFINANNTYLHAVISGEKHPAYVNFGYSTLYSMRPYGTLRLTYEPDDWAKWKIELARFTFPED